MSEEVYEKEMDAYNEDSRIACRYGVECYQKNPTHLTKFKHPPKMQPKVQEAVENVATGRKRLSSESESGSTNDSTNLTNRAKCRKKNENEDVADETRVESTSDDASCFVQDSTNPPKNGNDVAAESETKLSEYTENESSEIARNDSLDNSSVDRRTIIRRLFLTEMPDDFYKFYDFCKSLSPKNPCEALRLVDLSLVGPYDVLSGKIARVRPDDSEKYLRHWRYFYDPPEFQTILRGDNNDGLHYGYWRDVIDEPPVFVAQNCAGKDCKIDAVASNVFGAVHKHASEAASKANVFAKGPIMKLLKQLKQFAEKNDISLNSTSTEMKSRSRKVVAKTFHGAGIVVPYDKKTQLGYRDLAATDVQLQKILKNIDEAESEDERKSALVKLEEIIRLATIAADENDFGTCLELGHDLFSSGVVYVERIGLRVLGSAYKLLGRKQFLNIANAHAKDRKKGSDLSVV